ncbi:MAG: ArsA-related P-loop ATPase [Chloroflexota bacterium]|nr:ArsA-related P-loop ATPase [Chloroflexota bacterium]
MHANKEMRTVAIYGKGGIGKSVISANLSASLAELGETVLQVGCDPKHDSIATLCGQLKPTINDLARETERFGRIKRKDLESRLFTGFNGVLGCEAGGPPPAQGCAGKGVTLALELLNDHKVPERHGITFMIYDILGDSVCGGFFRPVREGFAREVYVVGCGEFLTLYMVNNILRALRIVHDSGAEVMAAGIIDNMRGVPNEAAIVDDFGKLVGVPVIHHVPRDKIVQQAEFQGKTVMEAFPESNQANEYRTLAKKVLENEGRYVPNPTTMAEIKKIVKARTEEVTA